MLDDPEGELARLGSFLGVDLENDPDILSRAVEGSRFESMKAQAEEMAGKEVGHLRKGKSGDWRNHFGDELAQEFMAKFETECAGLGLCYSLGEGLFVGTKL